MHFDDGTSEALKSFLNGGGADVLAKQTVRKNRTDKPVPQLSNCYFCDLSLAGWCISLGNNSALQALLKRGVDPTVSVTLTGANNCLHLASAIGTNVMIESILDSNNSKLRLEAENARGFTAMMEAAHHGNQKTAKRLVMHKASARRGIDGKYWGWMLAFARKQEETEKNLQTGRLGDDDERYFYVKTPGWMLRAMTSK